MKITHVVPYIYPAMSYGGPAKLVYQLALAQKRQGHQVSILTSNSFSSQRRFNHQEKSEVKHQIQAIFSNNILNSLAYNNRIFTHFGIIKEYFLKLKNTQLFHIHDVFILPQIVLMYLLILNKNNYIISPHGVLDPARTKDKSFFKSILIFIIKPCFSKALSIIATSDQEKEQLETIFPDFKNKIKTVWNGVEEPSITIKKTKSNKIRLLYIGKLHHKKGLVEFIKAFSKFPNFEKYFELTIAGPDDGHKKKIDYLIYKLGIKVQRLDFADENQKINLYKNSDVFIHPSESEGFSISIIEALAYGLPILVTKACNFKKEDLRETGFWIESNSQKEILGILSKIVDSKKDLRKMGKEAKKLFIKKYTIAAMAKNINHIFERFFFGIKLSLDSKNSLFSKSFEIYFPKDFGTLYPPLNKDRVVEVSFSLKNEFEDLEKKSASLSQQIRINEDKLWIDHNYLGTTTRAGFVFIEQKIIKINIVHQSSIIFGIANFLLGNLLRKNLFKQIIKKYIQHPLLLDISNEHNLNCLHASAIEKNNKVIAFMGMNSVGKSSLIAQYIIKKGYKMFSDNYLLISRNGTTYRYPSFIRLGSNEIEKYGLKNLKNFGYGKNISSIKLSDHQKSQLDKVYILMRGSKNSEKKISQAEAISLIEDLQIIDQEDVRFAVTQLKIRGKKILGFNKNVSFYIKTIKNNE